MINAILPIWKPVDWSSFDVVKKIRNKVNKSKVGHAGSLDPFAEGVLMLCIGKYTKSVESFMDKEKEYIATIQLGSETDTLDITGKIIQKADVPCLTNGIICDTLKEFTGNIMQEPPMYSALKVNGQRLYKLAREGINIPRKKRAVHIYKIELIKYENNIIKIKVVCGRGTYIRSLAKDIANKLNTVGFLKSLKRIRIGEYAELDCIKIDEFDKWISVQN